MLVSHGSLANHGGSRKLVALGVAVSKPESLSAMRA